MQEIFSRHYFFLAGLPWSWGNDLVRWAPVPLQPLVRPSRPDQKSAQTPRSAPVPLTLWGDTRAHLSQKETCVWLVGGQRLSDVSASQVTWLSPCNPNQSPRRSVWNWTKQSSCTSGRRNGWTQPAGLSRSIMSRSTRCNKSTYLMPIRGWRALFWALDIGYSVESSLQPYELGIMFNPTTWLVFARVFLDLLIGSFVLLSSTFCKQESQGTERFMHGPKVTLLYTQTGWLQ